MMKFKLVFVLCIWISCFSLEAQTKNEKESRIPLTEFPNESQILLKTIIKKVKRSRFYKETDGSKLSFESKFKYNKYWFSVEFNNLGTLEDIEVLVKEKHLSKPVKTAIRSYLKTNTTKYEIIKIQEQYVYSSDHSEATFLNSILENRTTLSSNYELIVAMKSQKTWELKELTFDEKGDFIKARNLQQDSYEYIMY
ncbi:hypothetical protein [Psychroserpens sp. SPM9]|uniref:hypothetical protein n=1 Tax=Psychroserpens sp. SPM9 TaxID=2975598 RepID=UPI0021A3E665|nr:hypothetical protein [Psychroserpens sp. SPM9]MDG5490405.1 hypothetical protein [Psychroserpens sp. SPM9]